MEHTTNHSEKTATVLKWALILGIIIVLNLFFNYTISLLYKAPAWDAFCPSSLTSVAYTDRAQCTEVGGQWNETTSPVDVKNPQMTEPVRTLEVTGYCDATYTCQKTYQAAQSVYDRNVFIMLLILGVISLALGFFLTSYSAVSLGLSFGGVVSLIIGSMRYWSDMHDWLRVAVLAAALIALIWLGIKKIRD